MIQINIAGRYAHLEVINEPKWMSILEFNVRNWEGHDG